HDIFGLLSRGAPPGIGVHRVTARAEHRVKPVRPVTAVIRGTDRQPGAALQHIHTVSRQPAYLSTTALVRGQPARWPQRSDRSIQVPCATASPATSTTT